MPPAEKATAEQARLEVGALRLVAFFFIVLRVKETGKRKKAHVRNTVRSARVLAAFAIKKDEDTIDETADKIKKRKTLRRVAADAVPLKSSSMEDDGKDADLESDIPPR